MRKFLTSFAFVIGVFLSGLIFGLGAQKEFTYELVRTAYNYGFENGRHSIVENTLSDYKPKAPNPGIKKPLKQTMVASR